MKKYVLEVQLKPELHEGSMKHYWHIDLITEDGRFTARHGYESDLVNAHAKSHQATKELGLV